MYGVKNWPGARQILSVVIFLLMVSTGAFLPAAAHADVAYTVTGNSQIIVPDDLTPSTFDGTDFGSVLVGSSVVDRTFVITNTGSESFDISNIVFTSSLTDFSIISPTSATLAPGGTFDLVIRLDPTQAGTNATEVRIIVPIGATNNQFRITGVGELGVPDINVKGGGFRISDGTTTPSHSYDTDFGSANVTGGLVSKTYTIENTGTGLLTLGANAATRTGAHAGDFTVTSQPAETVAAGGSTTVTVQFNPSAEGLRTATLSIANDDPDENPYDFSIQGTGTIPDISLEGNNVTIANGDTTPDVADYTDLGSRDIDAGGSTSRDFRVRNIGTGTLTLAVDAVTFSGPHAADFSVPDQPHTSLNAGQSDLFSIRFNPSALGLRTATVSIASDDPDEPAYTFAIAGTGTGEPVITISGNGNSITNNSWWTSVTEDTDFGGVTVGGGSDTHTFTITNTGNAPLTLTGSPRVVLSGTEVSDYTLVSDADAIVAANGGTTTFSIRFAPSENGDREAEVSIANNDSDRSPYSFKLTGEGTGPAILVEGNNLEIVDGDTSPSIADFTDFGVTDINSGVADRTFYINNDGTDPLLLPSGAVLSGPHKDDFSVTSQPDSSLNRSTRSNLNIRFVPSAAGVRTATVTIPNNDPNRDSFSFTIQGTGSSAPEIVVTGNGINIVRHVAVPLYNTADGTDFGTVSENGTMVDRTFVIKNVGTTPLNLGANAVTIFGYPNMFSVVTQPAPVVAPGQTTSFTLRYTATQSGSYGTSVAIQNDDGDESPFVMLIRGAGAASLPEINVTGNSVSIVDGDTTPDAADHTDFGSADVTSGTVSRTFTIENAGTDVLTITSAGLTGTDTADFSITTDPTGTVAASDTTTVVVEFNPTTVGPKSVTLTINSDDGDEAAYDFVLAGTATGAAEINVTGNSVSIVDGDTTPDAADHTDFGSTDVATGTVSRTFTIENTGTDVLTITGAALSGADPGDFSITTAPAGTVAAAASTTVVVEFNPTAAGLKSATLTINSDDADEAAYDFAIAGKGTLGAGTITLVVNSSGGDVSVVFGSPTPDLALTIATVSGTAQSTVTGMQAGMHTVTATNITGAGYGFTAISCNDSNSIGDVAYGMAIINLASGETVTCTFELLETRDATGNLITDYLGARNNLIMSHQPDRSRRMDRLRGGNGGPSTGTVSAYGFSLPNPLPVDMELNGNVLSYATSLNRLRRMNPAFDHFGNNSVALPKWDIWMEGQISVYDAPADSGDFSIAFAGVDYLLNNRALIGIMGQFDSMTHHVVSSGAKVSGEGWMIGPYGTFRLNDTFHLDLRGAWGQSTNEITPFGTYTDKFDTNRWLFTGALIGSFDLGEWTVSPGIEASYISETQQAYTDSLGVVIPKRTVSQGVIDIGPRLERDFELKNEKTLTFFTEFKGVYSFGESGKFSNGSFADETQGLTGTVGTGISIHLKSGAKFSLSGDIGGIGSGGNTYTGAAKLSIPLN